jgi:hypothetical protein
MSNLASLWAKDYNWSAVGDKINHNSDHYEITVPGNGDYKPDIPLHFVHVRSFDDKTIPLCSFIVGHPVTYYGQTS